MGGGSSGFVACRSGGGADTGGGGAELIAGNRVPKSPAGIESTILTLYDRGGGVSDLNSFGTMTSTKITMPMCTIAETTTAIM